MDNHPNDNDIIDQATTVLTWAVIAVILVLVAAALLTGGTYLIRLLF